MHLGTLSTTLVANTKGLAQAQAAMMALQKTMIASTNAINAKLDTMGATTKVPPAITKIPPALTQVNKGLNSTINVLNTVSQRFRTFGYLATAMITAVAIGFGKTLVQSAMEFEASLQKVVGLLKVSQQQVDSWRDSILEMTSSMGRKPKELGEALYFITTAGIRGQEAMDVMNMSVKASVAGMGDVKTMADGLTSAMNAWGSANLNAQQAADIFTATVREGKTEAAGLVQTLGMVFPIATKVGISLDQVGAGVASMTRTGTPISTAVMQLRQMLFQIEKIRPGREAEKILREMGSSGAELRNILKGEDGLIKMLLRVKELGDTFGSRKIAQIFPNVRSYAAVVDILGPNLEKNLGIFERMKETAGNLDFAYNTAAETMKGKYNIAFGKAATITTLFGETLGQTLLPMVDDLIQRLDNLYTWFNNLTETQKRNKLEMLGWVVAAGPISLAISVIGYSLGMLATVIKAVGNTFIWLGRIIKANPWTVAIAGAIALTAVIVKLVRKHNEYERVLKGITTAQVQETTVMDGLFRRVQSVANSTSVRASAIEEINRRYKDYLPQLINEKTSLEDIAKAYDQVKKAMMINIALKAHSEELEKAQKDTADKFSSGFSSYLKVLREFSPDVLGQFYSDVYAGAQEAIDQGNGKIYKSVSDLEAGLLYKKYFTDEIVGAAEEGNRLLDVSFTRWKMIFDSFVKTRAGEFPLVNIVDDLSKQMSEFTRTAEEAVGGVEAVTSGLGELEGLELEGLSFEDIWGTMKDQEKMYENLQRVQDIYGTGVSHSSDLIGVYTKALEDLVKVGLGPTGPELDYITARIKELNKALEADIAGTMNEFKGKWVYLQYMSKSAHKLGIEFDYVSEKTKALKETLEKLAKTGAVDSPEAKELVQMLRSIEPNIYGVTTAWKEMNKELSSIDMVAGVVGSDFDVANEKIKVFEKAIETIISATKDMENLEGATIFDAGISELPNNIKLLEVLRTILADLVRQMDEYKATASDNDFEKSINILERTAEAYGSVDNKMAIVSREIRYLESKLKAAAEATVVNEDAVKRLVKQLNSLKREMVNLQHINDITYFTTLYKAFGRFEEKTSLLEVQLRQVESQLRAALDVPSGLRDTGYIDSLIDKWGQLKAELEKTSAINDSLQSLASIFSDIGDAIGGSTGEVVSWIGQLVSRIPELIDLMNRYKVVTEGLTTATNAQTAATQLNNTVKQEDALISGGLTAVKEIDVVVSKMATAATEADTSANLMNTASTLTNSTALGINTALAATNASAKGAEAVAGATAAGAEVPFPYNIVAIALGVAAVIAALATSIPKMAKGGVVPAGYPNDTFPAFLSSGEVVIPEDKAKEYDSLTRFFRKTNKSDKSLSNNTKFLSSLTNVIKMAKGGVVPKGYSNDSYPALLSSGERVLPPQELSHLEPAKTNINITLDGEIKNRDLALVIRRIQEMN